LHEWNFFEPFYCVFHPSNEILGIVWFFAYLSRPFCSGYMAYKRCLPRLFLTPLIWQYNFPPSSLVDPWLENAQFFGGGVGGGGRGQLAFTDPTNRFFWLPDTGLFKGCFRLTQETLRGMTMMADGCSGPQVAGASSHSPCFATVGLRTSDSIRMVSLPAPSPCPQGMPPRRPAWSGPSPCRSAPRSYSLGTGAFLENEDPPLGWVGEGGTALTSKHQRYLRASLGVSGRL